MNVKRSVALAIRDVAHPGQLLLVQRPDDDEDLPGIWGLPAATLGHGESWDQAARRAAREKLGVEVDLGPMLNEGSAERAAYRLDMRLIEARITSSGSPHTDAAPAGTTRYQAWRWAPAADLLPGAEQGSLCSRLALDTETKG